MARIEKRPQANLDLYEIWEYIAIKSPAAADRIIRKINERFFLLAENPEIGKAQYDFTPGLRRFPVLSWGIFYLPLSDGDGIDVVRVLHERRDVESEFGEEGVPG